jgi:hypothetical protein
LGNAKRLAALAANTKDIEQKGLLSNLATQWRLIAGQLEGLDRAADEIEAQMAELEAQQPRSESP